MKEWTAAALTDHARRHFESNGVILWRNNQLRVKGRTFMGRKGVPDLIGFTHQGLFWACEVKKMGDNLSDEQIDFLNELSRCGGFAFVCRQNKDYTIEIINWSSVKQK